MKPHDAEAKSKWDSSPGDPRMLKLTEVILQTPDAAGVDSSADMLLIFLAAGGTVLGCIAGFILYAMLMPSSEHGTLWFTWAVLAAAVGGIVGCLAVMAILGLKGLVRWERQHQSNR